VVLLRSRYERKEILLSSGARAPASERTTEVAPHLWLTAQAKEEVALAMPNSRRRPTPKAGRSDGGG
jgi:hypothetical protein